MQDLTRTKVRHALRRRRSLGTAMLESAVTMPVLTAFLGMMTYNFKSYETRIKADSATRANVVDTASHNCEGGGSASVMDMGLGILDQATSQAGQKQGDQGAAQILGNMVQSAAAQLSAQVQTKFFGRQITSSVKMTCNEKPFDGNLGTWFKYAASAFTGTGFKNFP